MGSLIALEGQEDLKGGRSEVPEGSFEASTSFKVIAFRCSLALQSGSSAVERAGFIRVVSLHYMYRIKLDASEQATLCKRGEFSLRAFLIRSAGMSYNLDTTSWIPNGFSQQDMKFSAMGKG